MSYARVERIEADDIPVIDIASLKYADDRQLGGIADELIRAAEGLGFFYVKGHGVSSNLLDQTYNLAQSFF
ncbi:MAG TPA: 2OG-Fe(II) oxygenase, partial [Gammaproteobacteria bacterium]|nr:2OG-Fe(II) oxygenase [Gammaproteobacteria bacterium]